MTDPVAGILLAAGAASRFGADKLAADWGGRSLLEHAAEAMLAAGLAPVLAVVRHGSDAPLPEGVRAVANSRWRDGMATSVQAGLGALDGDPEVSAAVIAPADQPWCGSEVYRRLVDAFRTSGAGVVVAAFDGAMRNPVLLARQQWRLADRIAGDSGLAAVVRARSPVTVECADAGSVADIDTVADLERARTEDLHHARRPEVPDA